MLGYFSLQFSLVFSLKDMVIVRVVDEYCIVSSNRGGGGVADSPKVVVVVVVVVVVLVEVNEISLPLVVAAGTVSK